MVPDMEIQEKRLMGQRGVFMKISHETVKILRMLTGPGALACPILL